MVVGYRDMRDSLVSDVENVTFLYLKRSCMSAETNDHWVWSILWSRFLNSTFSSNHVRYAKMILPAFIWNIPLFSQPTTHAYCPLFLQNVRQLHAVAMLPSGQWGKLSVPGFSNKVIVVLRYSVDAEPNTSVNVDNKRGPKLQQRAYGVRVPGWPCGVTTFQHVRSFWLWITMASRTSPGHSYLCDLRHRVSSSNLRYYYRILPQVGV